MKKIYIILITLPILIFITSILFIFNYQLLKKIPDKIIKNIEDKKINLDNNYKKVKNFKLENLNRYKEYHVKNESLSYETVVNYVNIGLDYNFYNYINNVDMSKNINILINKYHKLENSYKPDDLEEINDKYFISGNLYAREMKKDAKEAFEKLSEDSFNEGVSIYGQSAYRSYQTQESYYNIAVNNLGQTDADNETARPGHSEHQTGLTIDVSSTKTGDMLSFDKTESFIWMKNNAYKYGFILRYPKGLEHIHGFIYESWHYRYVGIKVAKDMHNNYPNMTYDEYYYKFID